MIDMGTTAAGARTAEKWFAGSEGFEGRPCILARRGGAPMTVAVFTFAEDRDEVIRLHNAALAKTGGGAP